LSLEAGIIEPHIKEAIGKMAERVKIHEQKIRELFVLERTLQTLQIKSWQE
jgi:hypothetical protein